MVKEIIAKLKLDGKEFTSGIEEAKRTTIALTTAISAVSAAVIVAVKTSANYEDSLTKLSRTAGSTVQSFSELVYAADLAGIEHEKLAKNLKKLNTPSEEARKEFQRLGISMTDATGKMKTQDQLLNDLADGFKGMKSPIEMAQSATEVFGAKGTDMVNLLKDGSKGLKELRDEAVAMGIAFNKEAGENAEKFNDDLERITKSAQGATMTISNSIIALINQSGAFEMAAKAIQKVTALWNSLDEGSKEMIIKVGAIIAGIAGIITVAAGLSAVAPLIMSIFGSFTILSGGIMAGVAAAILFGVTVVKYWDDLKSQVQPLVDAFFEIGYAMKAAATSVGEYLSNLARATGLSSIVSAFQEWFSLTVKEGAEISVLGTIVSGVMGYVATVVLVAIAPFRMMLTTISAIVDAAMTLGQVFKAQNDEELFNALKASWEKIKEGAINVKDKVVQIAYDIQDAWGKPITFKEIDTSKARKSVEELNGSIKVQAKEFFEGIYKDYKEYADLVKNSHDLETVLQNKLKFMETYGSSMSEKQRKAFQEELNALKDQSNSYSIAIVEKITQVIGKITSMASTITGTLSGIVQNFNTGIQRSMDETARDMEVAQAKYTEQMQAAIDATRAA